LPFQKFRSKNVERDTPIDYQLQTWVLPRTQTLALVDRCRAEKTSVHAALGTAFLRAFGTLYQDGWNRKIQSPVNIRARLDPPLEKAFGCYIGLVEFSIDCHPELNFWEIARAIKSGFTTHTSNVAIFSQIVEIGVIMERLSARLSPQNASEWMKINYDLSISNLGRLTIPDRYGQLRLEAILGPTVCGIPEEIVLGVNTFRDQMQFNLIYTHLKLTEDQAHEIKISAMQALEAATH
jgi:hypothetical protein